MGRTNNAIEVEILETIRENFGESVVFTSKEVAFYCKLPFQKTTHLLKKLTKQGYLEKICFSNSLCSKMGMEYGYKVKGI